MTYCEMDLKTIHSDSKQTCAEMTVCIYQNSSMYNELTKPLA